ncbi:two-component system histidine kinase PnpS [Atopococcus tabaci]|uniref:two-component system histidine kinase PnpS n=1 Tax=Atopococcus tabaci TaxID=269774 RepID=UPI0003FF78D8|nr:ATP-binding protein [Atopococcus tabaci]
MKKLQLRIVFLFLAIFSLFSLVFSMTTTQLMEERSIEQQGEDLRAQLTTLTSQLNGMIGPQSDLASLNGRMQRTADAVNERVTLIDLEGNVVFDSHADSSTLDNHGNRPEVSAVLNQGEVGRDVRTSATTGKQLYYVAQPLFSEVGTRVGVLRLSKPIDEMEEVISQVQRYLLLFVFVSLLLAVLFTAYWTRELSRPISEIGRVAQRLSNQQYDARYTDRSYEEIDALGQAVNELADNLESQMQEITQNDEQMRELINHLIIGVMLLDNDRNVQIVNPAMSEILEMDLYAGVGRPYVEVIKSYGITTLIEDAYRTHQTQNDEISLFEVDNKVLDANVVPIAGDHPGEVNFIVLLYDITEIRRLEKVRTDFVANASHELRTPVTALKGFTETLLDGAMEDKEILVEFLTIMHKESIRLDSMVRDILQLSKLEHRTVQMEIETISIREIVEATFQIVRQKAESKEISLEIEEKTPVEIEGDENLLKQILLNLINNAVTYTPEKGYVKVALGVEGDEAVIHVEDNGIGIPEDEQSRVFERFYRVDKARSRNAGGTGLGLSIVKYLVENFNGSISLDSKIGLGTTFTVHLPLKRKNEQKDKKDEL